MGEPAKASSVGFTLGLTDLGRFVRGKSLIKMNNLTQSKLKRLLHYDPETGEFIRRFALRNNIKIGTVAGSIDRGYLRILVGGALYRAHRLAWLYMTGKPPKDQIDHVNGIKNDNRFCNLREATNSQNQFNSAVQNNKLGIKGVSVNGNGYQAEARVDSKRYYLGTYGTSEEASNVYQAFIKTHHGKFYCKPGVSK